MRARSLLTQNEEKRPQISLNGSKGKYCAENQIYRTMLSNTDYQSTREDKLGPENMCFYNIIVLPRRLDQVNKASTGVDQARNAKLVMIQIYSTSSLLDNIQEKAPSLSYSDLSMKIY